MKDVCGRTTLQTVATEGLGHIGMAFVNVLLIYGANIETQDENGQTLLHNATVRNHHLMVVELLKKGAHINAVTPLKCTALHLALFNRSHEALSILLDDVNLDYNITDIYGNSLIHYAAYHADIKTLSILRSRGLDKLDRTETDETKRYAEWRRNFNHRWASTFEQPRENDTVEWYTAFEELLEGLMSAGHSNAGKITDGGDMARKIESTSPDIDTVEEDNKDADCWQDAVEELC